MAVGNRLRKKLAEVREVVFAARAGGGNDHAARAGKLGEKRPAAGGAVDDGQRRVHFAEQLAELFRRNIGALQIEAGGLAIERAVADEHEPEGLRGLPGVGFEGGL